MRANYAITLGRERNCVSGVDSIAECWAGWGCLNSLVVWLMDVRRAAPQLTTSLASPWPVRVKMVTKQAAVSILMDGAPAPSPARPNSESWTPGRPRGATLHLSLGDALDQVENSLDSIRFQCKLAQLPPARSLGWPAGQRSTDGDKWGAMSGGGGNKAGVKL